MARLWVDSGILLERLKVKDWINRLNYLETGRLTRSHFVKFYCLREAFFVDWQNVEGDLSVNLCLTGFRSRIPHP